MNRRIFLLGSASLVAACAQQNVPLVAGPSQSPPGGRVRFDVGSVLWSEIVMPGGAIPHGQNVARAVTAGTVRGAGRRTVVLLIWGAPNMPPTDLVAYDNRAPYSGRRPVEVTEIAPTMAPEFDPDYEPEGPLRAFRFSYEGPMVSFELPRDLLARGVVTLLCPEQHSGRTVYPNRITTQNGLWHTVDMNRGLANPRWTFSTTRPLVWES